LVIEKVIESKYLSALIISALVY